MQRLLLIQWLFLSAAVLFAGFFLMHWVGLGIMTAVVIATGVFNWYMTHSKTPV